MGSSPCTTSRFHWYEIHRYLEGKLEKLFVTTDDNNEELSKLKIILDPTLNTFFYLFIGESFSQHPKEFLSIVVKSHFFCTLPFVLDILSHSISLALSRFSFSFRCLCPNLFLSLSHFLSPIQAETQHLYHKE